MPTSLRTLYLSVISTLCIAGLNNLSAVNDPSRPNVIFITVDQQRFDFMTSVMNEMPQYNGKTKVRTPGMDRLRNEGAIFRNFYTHCAVCGPARGVYRSGKTLENNGIQSNGLTNDETFALDPLYSNKVLALDTFDMLLVEEQGYIAEQYGKWHIPKAFNYSRDGSFRIMNYNDAHYTAMTANDDYANVTFSFDHDKPSMEYNEKVVSMVPMYPPGPGEQVNTYSKFPYKTLPIDVRHGEAPGSTTKVSQPDQQGRNTLPWDRTSSYFLGTAQIAAIDRLAQGNNPFIVSASFHSPHAPFVSAPLYHDYYDALKDNFFMPPSYQGNHLNNSAYNVHGDSDYQNEAMIRDWMVTYYALVEEVDVYVDKILDKLDEHGIADNTLVICTSDHGEMLGSHGMREKNKFLEESAHVTMLVRYPQQIPAGLEIDEVSSSLDIYATILDYCNLSHLDNGDGKSLRRFIEGTNYNKDYDDEHIVTEWDFRTPKDTNDDGVSDGLERTLGSETNFLSMKYPWKLMMTKLASSNRLDMLYNLEDDPFEMDNLVGLNGMTANDEVIGKAEHLKALLGDWMTRMDYDGNYSNPIHNEGVGAGDINEIKNRRKWRTVDIWVGDTAVEFGLPVDVAGQLTRNEYLYFGRTNGGTLNISNISVQGADAGFIQLSGFTSGNIASGNYDKVKMTYLPTVYGQQIQDARIVIQHNAGADKVIELSSKLPPNAVPEITSTPVLNLDEGTAYSYTVTATDLDNDPLSFTAITVPSWLTYNAATQEMSGTPSNSDIGFHPVKIDVSDGIQTTSDSFLITVSSLGNDAPIIDSIPSTGVVEDNQYSYTISATDLDGDSLVYSAVNPPSWLSFNSSTRILSGTPNSSNVGTHLVDLLVSDGTVSVGQSFYIEVFATPIPANLLGNPSFETGGVSATPWQLGSGAETSTESAAEGTATSLKITTGDAASKQTVTLEPNTSYVLSAWINAAGLSQGNIVIDTNDVFDSATGPNGPGGSAQFAKNNSNANGWTQFTGNFNSADVTSVTIRVFAGGGATPLTGTAYVDHLTLSAVGGGNTAPVITSIPLTSATEGTYYGYQLLAADAEGTSLSYSIVNGPLWLNIDPLTGILSGTPSAGDVGDHSIQLVASDGEDSASQNFTLTVAAGDPYTGWKGDNGIIDDDGDEDGDGISNLMEFALGADPNVEDSASKMPYALENGNDIEFKFHRSEASVTYTVEKSTDLSTWTDHDTDPGNVGEDVTVTVSGSEMLNGKLFLRLKVDN